MLPGPPPSLADGRVSFTLFRLECIELGQGGRGGLRPVDRLQFEQERGALSVLDPQPEHLLLARAVESERDVDGLVTHQALVPKLDPQGEENYIGAQRVGKDLAQPELELALPVRGSAIVSRRAASGAAKCRSGLTCRSVARYRRPAA